MQDSSFGFKKLLLFSLASILFLFGLFVYQQLKLNDGKLRLVFCDVGQGDGIYIRSPKGLDILIDGGPDEKILSCLSNNMPFWDKTIEIVVLTHPHADHAVGLVSVIKRYTVLQFYTEEIEGESLVSKELEETLSEKNIKVRFTKRGDFLRLKDGVLLATLFPAKEQIALAKIRKNIDLDANGLSVVQLLSYGDFRALLTGDSIMHESLDQKIDVLKVPHHGSRNNMESEFLSSIKPKLAVIQSGKNNRYGHPHKETLDLLSRFNIKVLRNDLEGELRILSDGQKWWLVK